MFTGQDTTYGEMRSMAEDVRDNTWTTATEKGLAISVVAIIEDFERALDTESHD